VVRASDVLMYGMHAPICIRDVEQSGELANAIMQVTQKIEGLGYSRQAEVHPLQFLLDAGNGRNKIEVTESGYSAGGIEYTHKQLLELSRFHPEQFSPGVLARPLVQDAILPTVASVLGGAEIAYHAQLFHAYQWLGIEQPVPLLRHSACVLDGRTERFLNKLNTEPSAFFRTLEEVESEFTSQLLTTVLPEENHTNESISSLLSPFSKAAEQIDPTLLKTVAAAATSIQQQTDGVRAKLKSAIKKSNSVLLDRVRAVWWTLFPDNTLQERVYPLLWHVAKHGTDGVRIIVETSCNVHRGNVAIVHILPEDQTGDQ
jgi:bacillithiol synthase